MARRRLRLEQLERRDVPSFAALPAYLAGASPVAIAGADVNEDGLRDIVAANHTTPGMVSVLLNQGGGSFDPPKSFPSGGSNPSAVAIADFNNNGRPDIAVANQSSGTVSILRGSGTGIFRRPQSYAAGPSPTAINVSDFNGDGVADIVVVNSSTTTISVLMNNGDGTLAAPTTVNLGTRALAVTTGDFNNDGNNDFIASGHDVTCPNWCEPINSRVTLYLGHGDGTFSNDWTYNTLSSPGNLTVADFDFDNKLDLVAIDTHSDDKFPGKNVNVFFGNGDGTFHNPLYYVVGTTPGSVEVADTNDDALLDIVVLRPPGPFHNVGILRGTIDGLFEPVQWHDTGINATGLSVVDYTGDGVADIGVVNTVGGIGTATMMINHGLGGFPASPARYGGAARYMTLADFTGDGILDFAATAANSSFVNVHPGMADGAFGSLSKFALGSAPSHVHANDFDGDGRPDLATSTDPGNTGNVTLALGSADADIFQTAKSYPAVDASQGMAVADFNLDGIVDLAVGSGDGSGSQETKLVVMLGVGGGAYGSPTTYTTGAPSWSVKAHDFNNDGIPDLVTASKLLLGVGDGTFMGQVSHGGNGCWLTIGDFNHDTFDDLATAECGASSPSDTSQVTTVLGNGNGTFKPAVKLPPVEHGPSGIVGGDFNNDGHFDIADFGDDHPVDPILIRFGNGNGTFQPPAVLNVVYRPHDVDVDDLNGDGNDDLVVCAQTSFVLALFGNGDGTFQDAVKVHLDTEAGQATVADIDGDGNVDIAAVRVYEDYLVGDLSIVLGNGDGTFQSPFTYVDINQPGDVIAEDLDGDGDRDVIVSENDNNGGVNVFLNTGGGILAGGRAHEVTSDANALASGDFDGDGRADLAVAHKPGAGIISVLMGTEIGFLAFSDGYPLSSTPEGITAADVNGDGELDLASANANGTVSILLGTGLGTFIAPVSYPAGQSALALAAADFDLDGDADLVVANNVAAGTISFLFNNGDGTFQDPLGLGVGASPQHVVTGDFNNDDKPDVAVANFGGGIVSVILGNGDGEFQTPLHFAVADNLRWLAAADVNNDGFTDLLVTSANGVAVLFNAADWAPLPIDYDPGGSTPVVSPHAARNSQVTAVQVQTVDRPSTASAGESENVNPTRAKNVPRHIVRVALSQRTDPAIELPWMGLD